MSDEELYFPASFTFKIILTYKNYYIVFVNCLYYLRYLNILRNKITE